MVLMLVEDLTNTAVVLEHQVEDGMEEDKTVWTAIKLSSATPYQPINVVLSLEKVSCFKLN